MLTARTGSVLDAVGYLGIFVKLPTFRGEIIYEDSSRVSLDQPERGWRVTRMATFTADTTLETKAGTYRCAGFSRTVTIRDTVYSDDRYWYAPGYGVVQDVVYSKEADSEQLSIIRSIVRVKTLLAR